MTISVVLATYNGAEFLREQLDSVLAQTLLPNEIIVSDDNSTDDTWRILEEYKTKYPDLFRIYQNENRLGAHNNFKHAFKYVTCDLVAPCDQDDVWLPDKLDRQAKAMQDGVSLVFCQEVIQYEDGSRVENKISIPPLHKCIFGRGIPGHLILCRRQVLNVFEIEPSITFDMGMSVYAAIDNSIVAIDYVGCIWRRHAAVVTKEYTVSKNNIVVERISSWKKWWRTLKLLLHGEYSEVIEKRMNQFVIIISNSIGCGVVGGVKKNATICLKIWRNKVSFLFLKPVGIICW